MKGRPVQIQLVVRIIVDKILDALIVFEIKSVELKCDVVETLMCH